MASLVGVGPRDAVCKPNFFNEDGTEKTALDRVVDLNKKADGAFRSLQLLEKITRVIVLILQRLGSDMAKFFEGLAGKLSLAWAMLTIPRLPEVTKKAGLAIVEWIRCSAGALDQRRDSTQKVHDVADAAATWGYAGALVAGSAALERVARVPDLLSGVTDMAMAAEDWSLAKRHVEVIQAQPNSNRDLHNLFVDTMRHALIRLVKAICSVVSGVLGLWVLAFGGPALPAAGLLAISLASTIAALSAHFFKETRPIVEFFKK